jgi:hypothetical protein
MEGCGQIYMGFVNWCTGTDGTLNAPLDAADRLCNTESG